MLTQGTELAALDPAAADVARHVEAMRLRVAELLEAARGEAFLSRLFWDLLDWDRVNQPVPPSVLPAADRADVADARIWARAGGTAGVYACYVRLGVQHLTDKAERPALRRLGRQWPDGVVAFSNSAGSEWDFCLHGRDSVTGATTVRRVAVDRELFGTAELAKALYALRAYDVKTDQPAAAADVADRAGRAFGRLPRQRRARRLVMESLLGREIDRHRRLLKAAEEQDLSRRAQAGDRAARDRMFASNLRLVFHVARRYWNGRLDFDDVLQEGCRGLLRAIEKFEPDRGNKFSTYAYWWISQAVRRVQDTDTYTIGLPCHALDPVRRWRRAWKDAIQAVGGRPAPEDVAAAVGATPDQVRAVARVMRAARRPAPLPADLPDRSADDHPSRHEADGQALAAGFARLTAREIDVLGRRYGLGGRHVQTLEEIGRHYQLTRERVRQIESKAMQKLDGFFNRTTAGLKLRAAYVDSAPPPPPPEPAEEAEAKPAAAADAA